MTEALAAASIAIGGLGLMLPWHRRIPDAALCWAAFPVGASVYMVTSAALLLVVGRVDPLLAVGFTVALGAGSWLIGSRMRRFDASVLALAAWVVVGTTVVALLAWLLPLARLTLDSGEYLLGAQQMQSAGAVDLLEPLLLKRQIGFQALHALATSDVRAHVAFVGPLFGVSGVGFFTWLVWSRMSGSRRWRAATVTGAVVFLISSSRFFYDFFYVHPHIQMATLLLIAVAGAWLSVVEREPGWSLMAGISLAATLLLRPEAPLLVATVLVAYAAGDADDRSRRMLAIPPLAVVVGWYGFVLWRNLPGGDAIGVTEPVFSSLVIVVAAAASVLVLHPVRWPRLTRLAGRALLPAIAAVLLVYAVADPLILRDSLVAMFRNLKRLGWWVTTWAVAVPLLGVALITHRVEKGDLWVRPIVGFGLLFFVFPYLRGSPWRVGPGDSGNRMLAHFLLVVLAFVLIAFAADDEAEDDLPGPIPTR